MIHGACRSSGVLGTFPSWAGRLVRHVDKSQRCLANAAEAARKKLPDEPNLADLLPGVGQAGEGRVVRESQSNLVRKKLPDGPNLADFIPGVGQGAGCSVPVESGSKLVRATPERKPAWLKMQNPHLSPETTERYQRVRQSVTKMKVATVCQEARCPNIGECWGSGTATIMMMGDTCTRGCRFCSVATSRRPPPLNPEEPENVAMAVAKMGKEDGGGINYVVLTTVDRDDLPDQGAGHLVETISKLRVDNPNLGIETLLGDYQGKLELVDQLVMSGMNVFAHNIETVERLQRTVRDRRAGYEQSLSVLRRAKETRPDVVTKSSLMLGLGETPQEVEETMKDLKDANVSIVTFGQYLQPTKRHMKVSRYVTPEEFDEYAAIGEAIGLHMASGPMVRSSYKAAELYEKAFGKLRF